MKSRRFGKLLLLMLVATACIGFWGFVWAAEIYPTQPVNIVVPFPPGGFIDLAARLISGPLSTALGQPVIVVNRAGAGGIVGTEFVARAKPDGYTLIVGSLGTHCVNQALYPKLSYNVLRDFQPIARLAEAPSILAVNPSFPVHSVKELIALARSKPKQIHYASAGTGTSTHLAAALFEHLAGVELVHVPYKGGGPAIIAVIAGEVPITFGTAASVTPHLKSGKLRGLAVTGGQRSALLPDLPTIQEGGLPGYEMLNWLGMFAPVGTPAALVEKLSKEAIRIMRLPEVVEGLRAHGAEPLPLGTEEFVAFVKSELEKWSNMVKATGMKAN
jgi:tripartite-type tricarboxylate transporter receptor subunit TctC